MFAVALLRHLAGKSSGTRKDFTFCLATRTELLGLSNSILRVFRLKNSKWAFYQKEEPAIDHDQQQSFEKSPFSLLGQFLDLPHGRNYTLILGL